MPRTIERTTQFKKDFKRKLKGQHRSTIADELTAVLEELSNNRPLTPAQNDHPLHGNWKDHRDCHVKPDVVLIYKLPDDDTLSLVRIGSHSELGI